VFVNLTHRSLGDQVKEAVKRGIPFFAAYGPEEVATQNLRLKTLATSTEVALPASELSIRLKAK
jgi:histidyl-tRNA synthetase